MLSSLAWMGRPTCSTSSSRSSSIVPSTLRSGRAPRRAAGRRRARFLRLRPDRARDLALDHTVPRIDLRPLPDRHVIDQSLRDLEFRLEVHRIGHPCQLVARSDQLPGLDIHQLQDPVHPGPDTEPVYLVLAQCHKRFHLLDARPLGRQLCFH